MASLGKQLLERIDAYEGQYIMVVDVPNAFIQTKMPTKKYCEERIIILKNMCDSGHVDMLFELYSETYRNRVVFKNVYKVIYDVVLRAIYLNACSSTIILFKKIGDLEILDFS